LVVFVPLLVLMALATYHKAIRTLLLGRLHLSLQVLNERLEVEVAMSWLPLVFCLHGRLLGELLGLKRGEVQSAAPSPTLLGRQRLRALPLQLNGRLLPHCLIH
jgi:hypothetical protein